MNEIVNKLSEIEKEMSAEKGRFLLFALFLREDADNLWDLLVSAPWASKDKSSSLNYISEKIGKALKPDEIMKLSRIVIIDSDNPGLDALHKAFSIEHGAVHLKDVIHFGFQLKEAYLITSKHSADHKNGGR